MFCLTFKQHCAVCVTAFPHKQAPYMSRVLWILRCLHPRSTFPKRFFILSSHFTTLVRNLQTQCALKLHFELYSPKLYYSILPELIRLGLCQSPWMLPLPLEEKASETNIQRTRRHKWELHAFILHYIIRTSMHTSAGYENTDLAIQKRTLQCL